MTTTKKRHGFYIGGTCVEPVPLPEGATPAEKVLHELETRIPVGQVIVEIPIDQWEDIMSDFGVLKP